MTSAFDANFEAACAPALMTVFGESTVASYTRYTDVAQGTKAEGYPKNVSVIWDFESADRMYQDDGEGEIRSALVQLYTDATTGIAAPQIEKDFITPSGGAPWNVREIVAEGGGMVTVRVTRYAHKKTGPGEFELRRSG